MDSNNSAIQVFNYDGSRPVRTVDRDGEVWFVAKDVCDVLGLGNPSEAIRPLDDDEKMTLNNSEGHSRQRGGAQRLNIVNEPGLYKLIFKSRKTEAKKFTRWVTHEVLPSIRKTGHYETGSSRKRMAEFDRAMKQGKEVYISMGYKGKKLAVALDKIYKDYLGFSALEIAGIDPNEDVAEYTPGWIRRILDYLKEHESVTAMDLHRATGIPPNTAQSHLSRMTKKGYLRKVGYGVYVCNDAYEG